MNDRSPDELIENLKQSEVRRLKDYIVRYYGRAFEDDCDLCHGSGNYDNGAKNRECWRCKGKGYQTREDFEDNYAKDIEKIVTRVQKVRGVRI